MPPSAQPERLPLVVPTQQLATAKLAAPTSPEPPLRGLALVAVSAVCFSIVTTLVKYETSRGLSAMETVLWRSAIAWALNRALMAMRGVRPTLTKRDRPRILLQCGFGFACIALGFFAISRMVLADASVLIFTSPMLTFFLGSLLLEEHIDKVCLGLSVFSGVGVVCVLRPAMIFGETSTETRAPTIAIVSALLAAFTQALLYVCVRRLQHIDPLVVAHYFAVFSTTAALSFILVFQSSIMWPVSTDLLLAAVGTGVFAFVGQVTLTKGFQLERAGIAAVMRYLDVVCVFIWDAIFLREPVSAWSVVGAAIVCCCALGCALRKAHVSK